MSIKLGLSPLPLQTISSSHLPFHQPLSLLLHGKMFNFSFQSLFRKLFPITHNREDPATDLAMADMVDPEMPNEENQGVVVDPNGKVTIVIDDSDEDSVRNPIGLVVPRVSYIRTNSPSERCLSDSPRLLLDPPRPLLDPPRPLPDSPRPLPERLRLRPLLERLSFPPRRPSRLARRLCRPTMTALTRTR